MQASQIVASLRANSADAPGELFDAYGEQLIGYCWQLLRSDDATLIAVRDTMIVAQAHAHQLRDTGLLGPWLLALARAECGRRRALFARKAGKAEKTVSATSPTPAEGISTGDRPPVAALWMREEILTSIADPDQARYRAVAAARAPRLGADGFPLTAGARILRRSHKHGRRRLRGGLLTAGAAAGAAMILAAAGLSLQGGVWQARPAASASPKAGRASGGPALENTAAPQGSRATGGGQARRPLDPPTFSPSATGQDPGLYDVDSAYGSSGPGSAAGPGDVPAALLGMPPMMAPPSGGALGASPTASPSATPWTPHPGSSSPSPAGSQSRSWAARSPQPSWSPPPSPATGSPAPPSGMDAGSSGQGAGGPPRHKPARRHSPNPSPGPDPGPASTSGSGGTQAQWGPGGGEGSWHGRGRHWPCQRVAALRLVHDDAADDLPVV